MTHVFPFVRSRLAHVAPASHCTHPLGTRKPLFVILTASAAPQEAATGVQAGILTPTVCAAPFLARNRRFSVPLLSLAPPASVLTLICCRRQHTRAVAVATTPPGVGRGGCYGRGGAKRLDESCSSCCLAGLGTSRGRLASIFRSLSPPPRFSDHPGTGVVVGSVGSVSGRVEGCYHRLTCPTALPGDRFEVWGLWCVVVGGRRCRYGTKTTTTTTTTIEARPPGPGCWGFVSGASGACMTALCS